MQVRVHACRDNRAMIHCHAERITSICMLGPFTGCPDRKSRLIRHGAEPCSTFSLIRDLEPPAAFGEAAAVLEVDTMPPPTIGTRCEQHVAQWTHRAIRGDPDKHL